ncbi:protein FMC1 homolog [Nilaparvata lugens]|uniref:protein FMC1 homolog n=1 Tax=Nilaparvata lugens TaxID=108931 RepID=UPI00193EC002|nr:protein FMC1 homolog [Nilaparvata lugens]XP_039283046.1 protein FMC1 homolog [Nilaparvata lugens]
MSALTKKSVLLGLRGLISELRKCSPTGNMKESLVMTYIFEQYRNFKVTDEQLCKAQQEMNFLAQSYHCYLRSLREYEELHSQYLSKGERTVKQTADLVGFKLPHDAK